MARCSANTSKGRQCRNFAPVGCDHCKRHAGELSAGDAAAAGIVGLLGHIVAPGLGTFIGAIAGPRLRTLMREGESRKARVFVSFDFDKDRALKEFLVGQSRLPQSPFAIVDHSLKEAAPMREWEAHARTAIEGCDVVIVIVGSHTHQAPGVLKEVTMARAAAKPIVQLIARQGKGATRIPGAGRLYAWTWDNLQRLLN